MRRLVMYSRPRCGLCDRARQAIEDLRRAVPFDFEEVSVDGDEDLERRYGVRVPVIVVDGEERFELEVDPAELRAALA